MRGAIIGDIIGSPYERNWITSTDFPLFSRQSEFTDDTVLTVAVADVLLNDGDYRRELQHYAQRYPEAGYGHNFKYWAIMASKESLDSYGNGSAMRVSPVGWAFDTLEEVLKEAKRSALPSHGHPEGILGAQAIAAAVFLARQGENKQGLRSEITRLTGYDLTPTLAQIRPDYRFDATCRGSVPQALIAFLESDDYESAVRNAVSLGGDSDTLATMAGAVAEAFYGGVPEALWETVMPMLPDEFLSVIDAFEDRYLGF
jgi:ADP-ribosylglycohydrolase